MKTLAAILLSLCFTLPNAHAANVGNHIDEMARKQTAAQLRTHPEYVSASAEQKKRLDQEILKLNGDYLTSHYGYHYRIQERLTQDIHRDIVSRETEKVLTPMQIQIEKKLQQILSTAIGQSLPGDDKRVPYIKQFFIPVLRQYVNEGETSAFYGLYEATNGDNHGTSLETIINGVTGADTALTQVDIESIFRRIGTLVQPNLNSTEIIRLRNYFFSGILGTR